MQHLVNDQRITELDRAVSQLGGVGAMVSGALRRLVRVAIGGCGLAFASADPASAHPHVWINAVATFLFEDGMLVGVRHHWEFDEMFGSYVIEEQDADRDGRLDRNEIASIQANAFSNLRDYDYFTHVRIDGKDMPLHEVTDFTARIENGVLVYEFTMPLAEPIDPGASQFAAGVYDAEYYVEVLLDEDDPVRFEGLPSGACTYAIREDSEHPIYYGMVNPPTIILTCATS
jgi:ABC-type uncharacterized transport system substrate-binding protein